ncbi:phosphatidylglycerol:prolipoprotein diacylglycerol transferase [Anaerocolumna jejuensis DSM 15929]|uniref:Phosphatidylglycerol--prolipoprotein diacylglyceryl transferase n=1 Tax=Anaerocolumna jejuensis DSM 15929 TaxID=1121322 RepID=A0A1M6NIM3_9FIRM|nr:prolipoprotein diacylglyceryl transferase [Anaerocolumna jejuensis]SHJ95588.1 phosphatidylglycerol:prolipoprotein diacylglycerol transferase [Anaerocolumna jejuensis DSM 15929]
MLLSAGTNINFPNLGIELKDVGSNIQVFGFSIAYYGMIIALGMVVGYLVAEWQAKRTGQNPDLYLDFALYAIILSVIGARVYYVVFNWSEYKNSPLEVFDIRNGGLAIYGGVITAMVVALVYSRIKKISFGLLADTGCLGLISGQIIGRWGNFFNREAFGEYTNGLFAMQLNINDVSSDYTMPLANLAQKFAGKEQAYHKILEIRNHTVNLGGAAYIQVQPTFLYESVWNLMVLILLIIYSKHKRFDGELILLYLFGYGLGRVWIEGFRTDQLFLFNTPVAVSQLLSGVLVLAAAAIIFIKRRQLKKKTA